MELKIESYQPLIRRIAVMHRPNSVDIDDAISAATIALYDCFRREAYSGKNNAQFETYIIAAMKYAVWNLHNSDRDNEVPLEDKHHPSYILSESKHDARNLIAPKLQILPDRERDIICRSFGIGRTEQTFREIAADLGISHPRVQQLRNRALRILRTELNGVNHG